MITARPPRTRRRRLSEILLRLAVRDREAYEGLLGDLHEEALRRADSSRRRPGDLADSSGRRRGHPADQRGNDRADRRVVLSLAGTYLIERARGWWSGDKGGSPPARRPSSRSMTALAEDFRHAARVLRRQPAFSSAMIATLGLGFGAATAVLSVAYGVWLRPLPFDHADALVRLYEVKLDVDAGELSGGTLPGGALSVATAAEADPTRASRVSPPLLEDLRRSQWRTLVDVAAVSGAELDWEHDGAAERLSAVSASRGIFEVLGLRAVAGSFFSPDYGSREVVLTEGFWRRAYSGSEDIIGNATLTLDGERYRVVGVVADGLPYPDREADVWTPLDFGADEVSEGMRGARYLDVVARLRPGTTMAAAQGEVDTFVRGLGSLHPQNAGWGATAVSLRRDIVRPFLGVLRLLLSAAALFLLIACANGAGLVAARRVRDRDSRRLRRALGASHWRVLRQETAELLLLGVGATAMATFLAGLAMRPLRRMAPANVPRLADIRIDPAVTAIAAVAMLIAVISIAVFGHVTAGDRRSLAGGGNRATAGARPRSAVLIAQVALTTVLLLGGASLASHFRDLARLQPGFVAEGVTVAPLALSARSYRDTARRLQFFDDVVAGLEQRGHRVAVGVNPPIAGSNMRFGYRAGDGEIDFDTEQHWGQYHVVSPRFFEVLGVPLLAGRGFDARDRDGSLPVVVINEALERTHFGGEAVGREMIVVGTRRQIVGVVGSVRHFGFDRAAPPEMYVPLAQDPWLNGHVLVRAGESYSAEDLRQVVASIDARVPAPALIPYEDLVRGWFAPLRFQLVIVTLLAMAGGVLAVVGLYALIAFVVAGSTREIGIRAALGEKSSAAFARVAGRGVALAAAGTAIGCAAAWAVRGVVLSFDTGVTAYSPTAVGLVVTLVIAAAGIACAVPARRAARVDPVTALRAE